MKRILTIILALTMLLSLASCNKDNSKNSSLETVNNIEPMNEVLIVTPDNVGTPIVDSNAYSFTVTSINTSVVPLAIDFTAENKSSDTEYVFNISNASSNGLSAFSEYDYYNVPVSSGGRITDTVNFSYSNVPNDFCNYKDKASCAFIWLTVGDSDGNEDYYKINIYPNGKSDAKPYKRNTETIDRLCYDADGIKLIYVGTTGDDNEAYFYLENNTDKHLSVSVTGTKVNGVECDGSQSLFAYAQTANYGYIYFTNSDFKNAGISSPADIRTIEITMDLVFKSLDSDFGTRVNGVTAMVEI